MISEVKSLLRSKMIRLGHRMLAELFLLSQMWVLRPQPGWWRRSFHGLQLLIEQNFKNITTRFEPLTFACETFVSDILCQKYIDFSVFIFAMR